MKYSNFLATYALDRLEFGDTTKYIYEGIYEVLEGKHVDLTNLDNYVLKVLDPDIICEDVILTEEIKNRIENEMQYPGTVKVTVIRETRAVEEAK